nr:hypothetical protein [Tanacetum cinerariifolium]
MTIYNALPRKEYERVFTCKTAKEAWHTLIITHQGNSQVNNFKIDLLTQEYGKFSISNEETIDSDFYQFNSIRAKVTAIKEVKYLATRPLDELIGNLKVYVMVLDNDGASSKITTKEKVKSLALKAKVTREQTSNSSDSQGESDEEVDEEEAKAFNFLARNFCKFFRKGNQFGRSNQFGNGANKFSKGRDSGCTKHMTMNRILFTLYKAYDGGHVVSGSNLKGKFVGRGNISHDSIIITNVEHVSGLDFNLIGVGHANMRLVQNLASNKLVRNLPRLSFERHFCGTCGRGHQGNAKNRTRKEVSTTRVLELLHLDLVGPSPIQSYKGNFYTLKFADDHSSYTWVVFV